MCYKFNLKLSGIRHIDFYITSIIRMLLNINNTRIHKIFYIPVKPCDI